jgi:DinB superfamily
MAEQMWTLLQRNLTGITEAEADWRPHPAANPVRWMVGHLAWFEEWAHDALHRDGRYLVDRDPPPTSTERSPSCSRGSAPRERGTARASPSSIRMPSMRR